MSAERGDEPPVAEDARSDARITGCACRWRHWRRRSITRPSPCSHSVQTGNWTRRLGRGADRAHSIQLDSAGAGRHARAPREGDVGDLGTRSIGLG